MAKADFSLPPSERSVYGATVTARASSGETLTLARVGMTAVSVPLVKGPATFTTACSCGSQLPGYHRMDCGVYA